jgi:hypothetical protein
MGQMVEETVLPRRQANKSRPVALGHFSHWPRCFGIVGKRGPQGVSGARRGLKHDRVGRCRNVKSEGKNGREGVAGKATGTSVSLCLVKGWAGRFGRVRRHAGRGGR